MKVQSSSQQNNRSWKSSSKTNGIANELYVNWHGEVCEINKVFMQHKGKAFEGNMLEYV
jgi:cobalamin biosynthesis Co2+ chelatase CbiK